MNSKTQNLVRINIARSPRPATAQAIDNDGFFSDFYIYLMTCSWRLLLALIAGAFFVANGTFAIAYYLDGGIENAHSFADTYFFSIETMATVGYGKMAPVTFIAHALMSVEALTGLLGFALVTGLIFAKFSRPTARVRFSRYAVIARRDGVPSLMFRMANVRTNRIVEAQIHVVFARQEKTIEGEEVRRFYDLALVRDRNAIFIYSWTATHQILPGSPLYGVTPQTLAESTASVVVSVTGLDETLSQTVHARNYYDSQDIRLGASMADIMVRLPDGNVALDFAKFDDIEPAPLPAWDPVAAQMINEA